MTNNYSPFHIDQKANFAGFLHEYSKKKSEVLNECYSIAVATKNINNIFFYE